MGLEFGLYLWALAALRSWCNAWRRDDTDDVETSAPFPPGNPDRREWWRAFGGGVTVQLANPKAAVFMLAFYPQFVPAHQPLFVTTAWLALAQVALETGLYLGLAAGVTRARGWFAQAPVRRALETVTRAVLVAFATRVAFMSRGT
ncbi:MAG: LysE family translocator [Actinomycetes bacterium]